MNLSEHSMGVPPELKGKGDQALCDALKILRLLHLKDLRGLQVRKVFMLAPIPLKSIPGLLVI